MVIEKEHLKFLDNLGGNEREIKQIEDRLEPYFENLKELLNYEVKNDLKDYDGFYEISKRNLSETDITEGNLRDFIYTNINNELEIEDQRILGKYTSIILELLNEKTENLTFYINGNGQKFDYLFYYAKNFHELIIDNFVGRNICTAIADKGTVNLIMAVNCKVQQSFNHIPFHVGYVDSLIVVNNIIEDGVYSIGNLNNLIIANNSGWHIGYNNNEEFKDIAYFKGFNEDKRRGPDFKLILGKNRELTNEVTNLIKHLQQINGKYLEYDDIMNVKQMIEEINV
ncbi:hypothetical protein ACFL1H_05490 [Nanoarchaeota archaeon]